MSRPSIYLERLRLSRSAVTASPFYTPEQKEAVLFTLDLIEFGEVPCDRDAAEGRDANAARVPQDRQARAEGIAQKAKP